MIPLSFLLKAFALMIPYGIIVFMIDWIYCKVIYAFTGRGI